MKKLTRGLLTSTAVAMAMGLSMQAHAGATAYSYLEVDNFKVFNNTTNIQLDVSDFSFIDIGDSSSASAVTSFGPPGATASPSSTDTLLACSGNCTVGENDPTLQPAASFGRGDTDGQGAVISGTPAGSDGADVWSVAEGQQVSTGFTTAQSGARTTTEFEFTLAADTTVRFDLDGIAELYVELHQDEVQAQASYSWNVSIVNIDDGNTEVLNWAPDGSVNAISGGTELSDDFSMNDSVGVVSAGDDGTGLQNGFFSMLTTLEGQTRYKFTIGHASQINTEAVKEQIPEPSILLLLGAGLAGLGFIRRRKQA